MQQMPRRTKSSHSTARCVRTASCGICGATFQGTPGTINAAMRLHDEARHESAAEPSTIPAAEIAAAVSARLSRRIEEVTTGSAVGFGASGGSGRPNMVLVDPRPAYVERNLALMAAALHNTVDAPTDHNE